MVAASDSSPADVAARYDKAVKLLPPQIKDLVDSPQVQPSWSPDAETFWYKNRRGGRSEFVLVDAEAGTRELAFDHARLAEGLKGVLEGEVDAADLPITELQVVEGGLRLVARGQRVEVSLGSYTVTALGPAVPTETPSPDGRWGVSLRDGNLFLRDTSTDEVRQLTTDGAEAFVYGGLPDFATAQMVQTLGMSVFPPIVVWSSDSTRFVTYRLDQRNVELMHLVRSAPPGGGRPRLLSYRYAVVGDPDEKLATAEYFVFDAATGEGIQAKCEPALTPFVPPLLYGFLWWSDDAAKVYFTTSDRRDSWVRLNELDALTGEVTVLVEEKSDTGVLLGPLHTERNVRVLGSGEVLWWSQRTDWGHLYLYGTDGSVKTLTSGEWVVRSVVSVDEEARRVVFTAAGRLPGSDPYLQELCSVSLDGGEITTITSDGLDHATSPSPSGRFFVDVTSRYDVPAVSVLRDRDGKVVLELEQADPTGLYAAGWTAPERAVVKAADGVTDIYCSVYKPHGFDPSKKYAVLDEIYPGPHNTAVPMRFPGSGGVLLGSGESAIFPALGFVLVVIDGRGSALRSKSFQDANFRNGVPLYVDDHATAIQQLGESRPWMDLDRVGIMGHSSGGAAATTVILNRPDVFKVAVASSGNHDNRLNHEWFCEKFYGATDTFDYGAQANASQADKLERKLFLIHGEMDDNVVPAATMRVVDALIAANKDFDMLIVPNAVHAGVVLNGYWIRKRWDYLVEHLMGEAPPTGYRIPDIPMPF